MKAKSNSITIWRILFTYLILIYHFDNKYCVSQGFGLRIGWYIGVEFFFIVSGYLLYANLDRLSEKCRSGWDYLVYRYKKIYPYYLGAFLFSLLFYFLIKESTSITEVVQFLSNHFFEMFAMHGIGLDDGWNNLNNTSWFISILFISGFIIYHCLVKWKDNFCNFVAPLIIIIGFSNLYRSMRGMGAVVQISGFYNNLPLLRGLTDMCLGIMAARLNGYIRANYKNTKWIHVFGVLGFVFVILGSLKFGECETDFLYALVLTVSIAIGFLPSKSRIYNCQMIHKWSALTMSMYFLHDAFRTFIFPVYLGIPESVPMKFAYLFLYLASVTVAAIFFDIAVKWCVKWFAKRRVDEELAG